MTERQMQNLVGTGYEDEQMHILGNSENGQQGQQGTASDQPPIVAAVDASRYRHEDLMLMLTAFNSLLFLLFIIMEVSDG